VLILLSGAAKAASTIKGYRDLWEDHIGVATIPIGRRVVPFTSLWMRNVRTVDVTSVLRDIAAQHGLSKNSLKHLKSFLSGIFTYAKQQGFLDGINPVQDAALPDGAEAEEQHPYTLEEIEVILAVLPDPAATIFACASYAGFRRSELRGLRWEEYKDGELSVKRGVWESVVGKTKTRKSRAAVPVITTLQRYLNAWREKCGNPSEGWIFPSERNTPLNLNNVVNRQIVPALNRCKVCDVPELKHAKAAHTYERSATLPESRGWHSSRRGLGTNLHRLGVSIETVARILRHAKASTTQEHYVLPNNADS
jgi:integrase